MGYRLGASFRFPLTRNQGESVGKRVARYIEQTIFRTTVAPEDCAAIIVEPVQGEGGYVVPSADFLPELRRICDEHGIALIVDEWGTWYQVEPGTRPRFLYQQNTMRDAIVAAISLDVFNRHCDRVRMANIAQTVNVLQAMILTQQEKVLLTPSYHVYEMYSVHQDATMVPVDVQSETYAHGGFSVPAVSASASVDAAGHLHLSLSNANPRTDIPVQVAVRGMRLAKAQGRILQGDRMAAHNTFEQPNAVAPRVLPEVTIGVDALELTLPKMSVAVIEVT